MNLTLPQLAFAIGALAGSACLPRVALAQEPPVAKSAEEALRDKWQAAYKSIAASIEMRRGETQLELLPSPLLFYTNPVRTNDQHGAIFLWTDKGRPAVFGSIWSAINRQTPTSRNVTHEWHSLIESDNARALRGDQTLWTSAEPGIAWQTLAGTPAPAQTRAARLVQMRALSRRLAPTITVEEESELRLMPQPLYRYPTETPGVIDGALLVYCMATDPELIMLIEAREEKSGPAYYVAIARFGNLAMTVKDGERTVWSCERGKPGRSDGKYYLRWRAEQMPAQPSEERRQ